MESLHGVLTAHRDLEHAWRSAAVRLRVWAASFVERELGELAGGTPSLPGSAWVASTILPRIGAKNPYSFVAPVFQPAKRADWKVGVMAARFIGNFKLQLCALIAPDESAEGLVAQSPDCGSAGFPARHSAGRQVGRPNPQVEKPALHRGSMKSF